MRSNINGESIFQEGTNDISRTNDFSHEQVKERIISLWTAVCLITDRGNNAEIKRKKDGSFTVYEVKKNIVKVR